MSTPIDTVLSFPVLLALLRVKWPQIVLVGIICGLLALPLVLSMPKTYQSEVTLFVSPPIFKERTSAPAATKTTLPQPESISEMMPETMPVESYKVIALSAPVMDEVIQKVPLKNTTMQGLRNQLQVELVRLDNRGPQAVTYTQTLVFHAEGLAPDLAAKIAETWAAAFKERVDRVSAERIHNTFSLLSSLHTNVKGELERAETALSEHEKTWNLDLLKAQLEAKQKQMTEFDALQKQTEVDLAATKMKLKALQEELDKEPQKIVYFRAPSDDAYWIGGMQNDGTSKAAPDKGLRTEEANETYVTARADEVKAKAEAEGLKATNDTLLVKLGELAKEISALTATFAEQTVERDKLTREAENVRGTYATVRMEYEEGRMAEQTQGSDIVIAGKAIAPYAPTGRNPIKLILIAACAGMFLAFVFLALKALCDLAPLPDVKMFARATNRASDSQPAEKSSKVDEKRQDS